MPKKDAVEKCASDAALKRMKKFCGCHGPFGVGGLVELPHKRGHPPCIHCSESVKIVLKKCDLKKDTYYLDECIEIFPLDFECARVS